MGSIKYPTMPKNAIQENLLGKIVSFYWDDIYERNENIFDKTTSESSL